MVALAFLAIGTPAFAQRDPWTWVERYEFKIDPQTPINDLLPIPPTIGARDKLLIDDLTLVPEVQFSRPYVFAVKSRLSEEVAAAQQKAAITVAHQLAKINHVNAKKTDHFMERLLEHRPDLRGLPFTLGGACRLNVEETLQFRQQVASVRAWLTDFQSRDGNPTVGNARPKRFWDAYDKDRLKAQFDAGPPDMRESNTALGEGCATAVLTQMLATESTSLQSGLLERLASFKLSVVGKEKSSDALARIAVFSLDEDVRAAAIEALAKRGGDAGSARLRQALRYPWPAVAKNAADAIVQLNRLDFTKELINLLEEPDPRQPTVRIIDDKEQPIVRELVRINHHRNCMLCHPPGNTPEIFGKVRDGAMGPWQDGMRHGNVGLDALRVRAEHGPVPVPGVAFPTSADYYSRFRSPDLIVRADATYLRQDFSLMQIVADAEPWPAMQRFDFLVRTRVITEREAKAYQTEFADAAASPYRQAALNALRRLTGQDAGATAKEWRVALNLP
jgi:hypothetical protein